VGVGDDGGDELCAAGGDDEARCVNDFVPEVLWLPAEQDALLPPTERRLHLLVQHPLEGRLGHAEVRGAHAFVETPEALVPHDLANAVPAVAVLAVLEAHGLRRRVLVQLEARLDQPDGVRGRRRDDAGEDGGREMDPCRLLAAVEVFRDQPLPVAVRVEVDRPGRHNADQVGPQPFEQCAPALGPLDRDEDLKRLA